MCEPESVPLGDSVPDSEPELLAEFEAEPEAQPVPLKDTAGEGEALTLTVAEPLPLAEKDAQGEGLPDADGVLEREPLPLPENVPVPHAEALGVLVGD